MDTTEPTGQDPGQGAERPGPGYNLKQAADMLGLSSPNALRKRINQGQHSVNGRRIEWDKRPGPRGPEYVVYIPDQDPAANGAASLVLFGDRPGPAVQEQIQAVAVAAVQDRLSAFAAAIHATNSGLDAIRSETSAIRSETAKERQDVTDRMARIEAAIAEQTRQQEQQIQDLQDRLTTATRPGPFRRAWRRITGQAG